MIAIIYPNNYVLDETSIIKERIESFVKIISIKNSLSDAIIDNLNPSSGYIVHTEKCYADENYTYQICHAMESNKEVNEIGIALNEEHIEIKGNVILMKFESMLDGYEICNITIDDVIEILRYTIFHNGIVITPNDDIDEFRFKMNPFEWMTEREVKNLKYFEIEILEMIIYIYIQLEPENNKLNNITSALLHENEVPIFGNVYLVLTNLSGYFIPFKKEIFKKLLVLMSGDNFNKKLIGRENEYKNSFVVIQKRYKEYIKTHSSSYIPFIMKNTTSLNEIAKEIK